MEIPRIPRLLRDVVELPLEKFTGRPATRTLENDVLMEFIKGDFPHKAGERLMHSGQFLPEARQQLEKLARGGRSALEEFLAQRREAEKNGGYPKIK